MESSVTHVFNRLRPQRWAPLATAALMAACGGADAWAAAAANGTARTLAATGTSDAVVRVRVPTMPTRAEAARFLTQASFGPSAADTDAVMSGGYEAWLKSQFSAPA